MNVGGISTHGAYSQAILELLQSIDVSQAPSAAPAPAPTPASQGLDISA